MPRRAPRQKPHGQSDIHAPADNHCRAVVRSDGSGIRKKIKQDYEKALRDLANSRRVLDHFHQLDQPAFSRWLNGRFGALLTELRELSLQLETDSLLIQQVENEVEFGGYSEARAYQRVIERRDNPDSSPPPPTGDDAKGKRDPFESEPESGNLDEDPLLDEIKKEFFRRFGAGADPRDHAGAEDGPLTGAGSPAHASKRLKGLYRKLVRQLHPDSQHKMTAQKTEWWHQAQTAYEAGDAEQLEVILSLCEIGERGTTEHTSAALLQRITAQMKSSLRELKRQLAEQRKKPAWDFSRRTDHESLAGRIQRELQDDLLRMRYGCGQLQKLIARWKAAAEKLKPPRRRKKEPSPDGEFQF
jgi:hypothetical protein